MLDRQIAAMDELPCFKYRHLDLAFPFPKGAIEKRAKLDQKRKEVRAQRKNTK